MHFIKSIRRFAFFAAIALAGSAQAADQIDNPQYGAWAKYKPGTTRTMAGDLNGPNGMVVSMEMTSNLVEVKPESADIETSVVVTAMGQRNARPAQNKSVMAKVDKHDIKEVGKEDVQAMGKTFKCTVYQMMVDSAAPGRAARANGDDANQPTTRANKSLVKVWFSPDVPGGLVKMNVNAVGGEMTLTLKSYEAK